VHSDISVVDLRSANASRDIDRAARDVGFVLLDGHGITADRREGLLDAARRFFALPTAAKQRVSLEAGGSAWRGWFPLGGELTSGVPDRKEGFYMGRELPLDPSAPPLHGPNVWPAGVPELAASVHSWMDDMERVGQTVLAAMAEGLGLDTDFFRRTLTTDPTVLFRIFRYPPHQGSDDTWGVGEHTDYGLVTLLVHDGTPGLEVFSGDRWIAVDPDPDLIVCNLGDMLDRLTGGRYRSTPHRVRNHAGRDRLSMPFFLDPAWNAAIEPLELDDGWTPTAAQRARWDRADLTTVGGEYGDWLVAKVSKVFPHLAVDVLPGGSQARRPSR
jgi:isopenicillin N synthase-like dioxygenase